MNNVYIVYFIVTLISFTVSNEQYSDNFIIINGETYDISPTDNHIPIESIPSHTLRSLNHSSLNSPYSDVFVDLILAGARKSIKDEGLDPADLPDAIAKFSKKILGIKVWGEAKVWDGHFAGLSTLTRTGPTSLGPNVDKMQLTANIGIKNANARYSARYTNCLDELLKMSADFMKIGVKAQASVDIQDIEVYLAAEVHIIPGAHLKPAKLKITDIGKLKVHFHGLGPLDWVIDSLGSFIGNMIRDWLSKVLEGPIKDAIQQMLDNLPIP